MLTVLVVEDTPLNLKLFRLLLEHAGYEVLGAGDGGQALTLLESIRPDLVLMDVQLPEVDGLTVTRIMKSKPETASIPVIVVTGYASASDRKAALDAGADAFLPKPIDNKLLLATVARFLNPDPRPDDP